MGFVKSGVPMLAAMLLSGITLAATSSNQTAPAAPMAAIKPAITPVKSTIPTSITTPLASVTPIQAPAVTPVTPKLVPVYADVTPGQPGSTTSSAAVTATATPSDVNTEVPYASMLPPGAEIVPGDPTKNEFFIVAAEDAAKIKHLLAMTKPGREIVAEDIKSKQPIVKVKLDEGNATLVSMDIVSSVKTVAKQAMKPSVAMTETDEVMSIFTKNRITPVGSRVVAVNTPKLPKTMPDEMDAKPMLKLLAENSPKTLSSQANQMTNPLTVTTAVKPAVKRVMPDQVAVKETIEPVMEKPVDLPVASKEAAPTLEMVMQQVDGKKLEPKANISKETFAAAKTTKVASVKASSTKSTSVSVKSAPIKIVNPLTGEVASKKVNAKKIVAANTGGKKAAKKVVAGKVVSFAEFAPVKAEKKKSVAWSERHATTKASKTVATKKSTTTATITATTATTTAKKMVADKKRPMNLGVVRSYADYLTKTGHRPQHSME